jgi:CheY-like chemotaxis protein
MPSGTRKTSIVFVDNDRLFLEAMTELLTEKGFAVHTARDGLEALAVVREVVPDFVLLDIVIPKIDGGRVCAAIRQDARLRDIPIIAFSSLSPQDYRLFPGLRADAYVAKGPLATAGENILKAIAQFQDRGRELAEGQVLGYDNYRPRQIINELLLERRHQAALLRALGCGVLEMNREGRIVMANPRACDLLKTKEGLLIGEQFSSLYSQEQQASVHEILDELARSPETERCWTTLSVGGVQMPVRLAPIVEEHECTGLLVTIEVPEPRPGATGSAGPS